MKVCFWCPNGFHDTFPVDEIIDTREREMRSPTTMNIIMYTQAGSLFLHARVIWGRAMEVY